LFSYDKFNSETVEIEWKSLLSTKHLCCDGICIMCTNEKPKQPILTVQVSLYSFLPGLTDTKQLISSILKYFKTLGQIIMKVSYIVFHEKKRIPLMVCFLNQIACIVSHILNTYLFHIFKKIDDFIKPLLHDRSNTKYSNILILLSHWAAQ
jgi:hypothetical protein